MKASRPLLGAHLSIAGGLHRAIGSASALGCNVLQIFTKNASTWREKQLAENEIETFQKARKEAGISCVASHTSYLINIAGPDEKKSAMSFAALKQELIRCSQLGLDHAILHPGSHMGAGEDEGIQHAADMLNRLFEQTSGIATRLLLETTAGQGDCVGHALGQLADIVNRVADQNRVGICLDTCHIFAAGYDISTEEGYDRTMAEFERLIGFDRLFAIHVNDSKRECGSRVDRHEHIGKGRIGLPGFKLIMNDARLRPIPKILETPKREAGRDADPVNLNRLRALLTA